MPRPVVAALRAGIAVLGAILFAGCTNLFLQPLRPMVFDPALLGATYSDVKFTSSDGVLLDGWFFPAPSPAKGTVVFLHGNGENISTHFASVYWLPAEGYNVFAFDYRGYGRSRGKIDLAGAHRDAAAAIRYVQGRPDVDPARLIVFGQSLGAAIAVYTVAGGEREGVRAVVIESGFSGYRRMAREVLSRSVVTWPLQWPLSLLVSDRFNPEKVIARVAPIPLLIIHGDADEIVSFRHARRLYEAAGDPKELWRVPGGGHIRAFVPGSPFRARLVEYLDGVLDVHKEGPRDGG